MHYEIYRDASRLWRWRLTVGQLESGKIVAVSGESYHNMNDCIHVIELLKSSARTIRPKIYKDKKDLWRWKLKAKNGKQVAASGKAYLDKENCLKSIEFLNSSAYAHIFRAQESRPSGLIA